MNELAQNEYLQIKVKRKTEPIKEDLEADLSIEKHFVKLPINEDLDIDPQSQSHKSTQIDLNTSVTKNAFDKSNYSWDDIYTHIRSLTGQSFESIESYISTLTDVSEGQNAENNPILKKKWVIYDLVKLGLSEEQIREAFKQLDALPDHITKEDMIKNLVENVVARQNNKPAHDVRLEVSSSQTTITKWRSPPPPPDLVIEDILKRRPKSQIKREISIKEIPEVKKSPDSPKNQLLKFECPICFNLFPENLSESLLKCGHSFCTQCYKTYLQEHLQADRILDIRCPYDGCQEKFQDECVLKALDETDGLRYKRLKKNALLNQNPNLKWCVRPGCEKYAIGEKGTRMLTCECGSTICFKCGNAYHKGKSCDSVINKVYKKYARERNIQNCPQCKSRIEKIEGCNHITCSVCKYQWCWLCRRKYTIDHYSRLNTNGCPGLQNATTRPSVPSRCKERTKEAFGALGYAILVFIAILVTLPFLIVYLFAAPFFQSGKPADRRSQNRRR